MKYYFLAFKNVFNYTGKFSLSEFWMFMLVNYSIIVLLIFTKSLHGFDYLPRLFQSITLFPFLACGFRRVRVTGQSAWLFLIPFVNLFLAAMPSSEKQEG